MNDPPRPPEDFMLLVKAALEACRIEAVRRLTSAGEPLTMSIERLAAVARPDGSGHSSEWRQVQVSSLRFTPALLAIADNTIPHRIVGFREQLSPLAEKLHEETDLGSEQAFGALPSMTGPDAIIARCLVSMVTRYLRGLENVGSADGAREERLAAELFEFAYGSTRSYLRQLVVAGVEPAGHLMLSGVQLRPVNDFERGFLWQQDLRQSSEGRVDDDDVTIPFFFPEHALPDAVLQIITTRPRQDLEDKSTLFNRVLLAFSLKGFDLYGFGELVGYELPNWTSSWRTPGPAVRMRRTTGSKAIDQRQFEEVVTLALKMPDFTSSESSREEIVLDRMLKAVAAPSESSGFLDYVIALEAALLGGVDSELSYRFALYGALFLGEDLDPQLVFRKLQDVYRVRSKIVHGSPVKPELRASAVKDAALLSRLIVSRALEQDWPESKVLDARAMKMQNSAGDS